MGVYLILSYLIISIPLAKIPKVTAQIPIMIPVPVQHSENWLQWRTLFFLVVDLLPP